MVGGVGNDSWPGRKLCSRRNTERVPQNVGSVVADRHSPCQVWLRGSVVTRVFPATHSSAKTRQLSCPDVASGPGARLRIFPLIDPLRGRSTLPGPRFSPGSAGWYARVFSSGAKCTKNQRFEIAELSGARSGWIGIEIGRTTL